MEGFTKRSGFAVLLVLVFFLESSNATSNLEWVEGRDGSVPDHPVVGGKSYPPGEVLYVARIDVYGRPTPGKMAPSHGYAYAPYGGREWRSSTYEILTNPGYLTHLEWVKSSGSDPPANAVLGGYDIHGDLYVARFRYTDGNMTPGKASYVLQKAYISYGGLEYEASEWWVLVEGVNSKRSDFPKVPSGLKK